MKKNKPYAIEAEDLFKSGDHLDPNKITLKTMLKIYDGYCERYQEKVNVPNAPIFNRTTCTTSYSTGSQQEELQPQPRGPR